MFEMWETFKENTIAFLILAFLYPTIALVVAIALGAPGEWPPIIFFVVSFLGIALFVLGKRGERQARKEEARQMEEDRKFSHMANVILNLRRDNRDWDEIASILNEEGIRDPSGRQFTPESVESVHRAIIVSGN